MEKVVDRRWRWVSGTRSVSDRRVELRITDHGLGLGWPVEDCREQDWG